MQAIVRQLSRRASGDALVEALLWCSLYALESGRYAEYTVVDQAVRACGLLERWNAKGYVNALLRGFLRERGSLEARIQADLEARYQHPRWWIELAARSAIPRTAEAMLAAGNSHPPMCLRVNRRRVERCAVPGAAAGSARHRRAPLGEEALLLERPVPVERLPGFDDGEVSVQDAGAQRAALLPRSGRRPARARRVRRAGRQERPYPRDARDVDADGARRRRRRAARGSSAIWRASASRARVVNADCTRPGDWWDGVPFDRILADVPCSASGIARRHPDIKWLRRADDVAAFAARQGAILDALWQVLGADGKLLYATCSVFPQENDAVIDAFVARSRRARRSPAACRRRRGARGCPTPSATASTTR